MDVPELAVAIALAAVALLAILFLFSLGEAQGSCGAALWRMVLRCGRIRSTLAMTLCDRPCKRYTQPATCQIPMFHSVADVLHFAFGFRTDGVLVEVGGFDGESFSNTATLADLGWTAHYVEPIPDFAAQCENRHRHNPNTKVHRLAVTGHEASGKRITLRPAGPFTSGLDEETSLADTSFGDCLRCVGWGVAKELVHADATDLDTFCDKHLRLTPARVTADPTARAAPTGTTTRAAAAAAAADKASPRGDLPSDWASQAPEDLLRALRDCEFAMDLLIVDVEGLEWTILQDFDIARWRPRVAIVEIQEKLRRYRDSGRAAADAIHIETWFAQHGYSILYRDAINTVFVHRGHICHGESS